MLTSHDDPLCNAFTKLLIILSMIIRYILVKSILVVMVWDSMRVI